MFLHSPLGETGAHTGPCLPIPQFFSLSPENAPEERVPQGCLPPFPFFTLIKPHFHSNEFPPPTENPGWGRETPLSHSPRSTILQDEREHLLGVYCMPYLHHHSPSGLPVHPGPTSTRHSSSPCPPTAAHGKFQKASPLASAAWAVRVGPDPYTCGHWPPSLPLPCSLSPTQPKGPLDHLQGSPIPGSDVIA